MKSVFRLAARRTICPRGLPAGLRAGEWKTCWTKPRPHRWLWAFNGPRWNGSATVRGVAAGRLGAIATATSPAICQPGLDLTGWAGRWHRNGTPGPSVGTPMSRTARLHAMATSIVAH